MIFFKRSRARDFCLAFFSARGFTLVELAIVIAIVGFLAGGVLKGMEMLRNARMSAGISQMQALDTAIVTFRDKYDSLPGDMINATSRLPNCTGTCVNGNADGVIGRSNVGAFGILLAVDSQAGFSTLPRVETAMVWRHLMHADLITGVTGGNPAQPEWGVTHPSSKFKGGIHLGYLANGQPLYPNISSGHYAMLRNLMFGGFFALLPGQGVAPPITAVAIDRKIDDGDGLTGNFLYGGVGSCFVNVSFDPTSTSYDCVLIFKMGLK